ncbi:hypothetical protein MMC30_001752 [Trapelia coarctata]|nr:hypothetical protein [Trapelia coarctata]
MSKRTLFTTITPLPPGITRASVLSTLHDHVEMIDLQPLVEERHPIKPPSSATAEEFHAQWYSLTDKVSYLPGGLYSGRVSYNVCFHNLPLGMQSHVYAPLGLSIKNKWTLGGSLPGEMRESVEMGLGVPREGLWLREDVDMRCNILMTAFVRKTLKKAHHTLVARLVEKAHLNEAERHNAMLLTQTATMSAGAGAPASDRDSVSSYSPSSPGFAPAALFANPHDSVSSIPSQGSRASYQFHSDPHQIHYDPGAHPALQGQGLPPPPRYSQGQGYAGFEGREGGKSPAVWAMAGDRGSGRVSYVEGGQMGGVGGMGGQQMGGQQMGGQQMGGQMAHAGQMGGQMGPVSPQAMYMDPAYAAARPQSRRDEKGWEAGPVELPGREGKGPVELP